MSDDWQLASWDGATVHGDPRDRIANQQPRRLDLDAGPPPLPPAIAELAELLDAMARGARARRISAELVAKVEALLDSPHAGERAAARAALDRLRA